MKPVDVGWLAGILDGEGTITLLARSAPRFRQPTLSVTSTDLPILTRICRLAGGHISRHTRRNPNRRWRAAWIWKLNGASTVLAVLRLVVDHLRCPKKRRRARFLLAHYGRVTQRNGRYSAAQRARKVAMEQRFFEL
jgi:hypothetical protein